MKQPSHITATSTHSGPGRGLRGPLVLGAFAALAALAACGDDPEPGILVFDRTSYDFGTVRLGQASPEQIFTVRNAGPDTLDGLEVRLEFDGGFDLVGTTCVGWLEPSETCTITVAFDPSQGGTNQTDLIVEADRADARLALAGAGAVLVRVTNNVPGATTVISEPAGIDCGVVCEALVTAPEVILTAGDGGIPIWSGACEPTDGKDCVLRLQEDALVELMDFAVGVQWIVNDVVPRTMAIDGGNNIIGTGAGSPLLFKMSPDGAIMWQTDDFGDGLVAVDLLGNVGFASFVRVVSKLDAEGNLQWSTELSPSAIENIVDIAFDSVGDLYVLGMDGVLPVLIKLGNDGGVLWTITEPSMSEASMTALAVDADGNVLVSGSGRLPPPDLRQVHFLRKYDGGGNVAWTVDDLGFTGFELAVDAANNIFVASRVPGGAPGHYDLAKYTINGEQLWSTEADDLGGLVLGLAVTEAGDVIAAGTRFDGAGGAEGVWAAKFDGADGTRRRPVTIQLGSGDRYGHAVAIDHDGNVLLSGGQSPAWLRKYDGAVFDQR